MPNRAEETVAWQLLHGALQPDPARVAEIAASTRETLADHDAPDSVRAAATLGRLRTVIHQLADTYTTTTRLPPQRRLDLLEADIRSALTELAAHDVAG